MWNQKIEFSPKPKFFLENVLFTDGTEEILDLKDN
jgi:hypothetical protein